MIPFPTAALDAFEQRYRRDHVREHALLLDARGCVVVYRDGEFDQVTFEPEELAQAIGGTLTHNHPRGKPPSKADLTLSATYGLTLRAVGIAPDGASFEYTVAMPGPSRAFADYIDQHFDDDLELAERSLSTRAWREEWNDFAWERETRHLAVTALAERLGFTYQRVFVGLPLVETSHDHRRLDGLAELDTALRNLVFGPLHEAIAAVLTRQAGFDGQIAPYRLETLRREIARHVMRIMLGTPTPDGTLTPYTVQYGEVVSRSAYFAALWSAMRQAATVAIERQAAIMRKHLPQDLVRAYEMATLSEMDYDPLHRWLDGKRLSDRIWAITGELGRKLDVYLGQAIARKLPVQQMARELEDYLLPGRRSVRSGEFAFDALRLARTEVAAAGHRADYAAAQLNPFVETYQPYTVPAHQCCDRCDDEEANGPYPMSDAGHLPTFHPSCLCGVRWNEVHDPAAVIAYLRRQVAEATVKATRAVTDVIGPLSKRFLALLFGGRG